MSKRLLIGGTAVIALLLVAIGVLWVFGGPQPGSTVPLAEEQPVIEVADQVQVPEQAAAESAPGAKPELTEVDPNAEAPEPDLNSPLAIQIPGCKCHSDDPKLVKQHEAYRMNQCAGCHAGKTPTGQ